MSYKIPPANLTLEDRALNVSEAANPEYWPGLAFSYMPCLGYAGNRGHDLSPAKAAIQTGTTTNGSVHSPWGPAISINGGTNSLAWIGTGSPKFKPTSATPLVISAGVRWNASAGGRAFIFCNNVTAGATYRGIYLYVNEATGTLRFGFSDGAGAPEAWYYESNASFVPSNTWTHVMLIVDAVAGVQMLADGVMASSVTLVGVGRSLSYNTGNANIGRNGGASSVIDIAWVNLWCGNQFGIQFPFNPLGWHQRLFADPFAPLRRIEDDEFVASMKARRNVYG